MLQLLPQHSSKSSLFAKTLDGVVWNELGRAGVGTGERFPKPRVVGKNYAQESLNLTCQFKNLLPLHLPL